MPQDLYVLSADSRERRICHKCIADDDLKKLIKSFAGPRGCSFCRKRDATTMNFSEFCDFIKLRLEKFYGLAVDQLPYESAEGGYQGWHVDTYDLLYDEVGLELERDSEELRWGLTGEIGDDTWCEYDWLVLETDKSLEFSWDQFCDIIKHRRRFFFHGVDEGDGRDPDSRSPAQFLEEVCELVQALDLIDSYPEGSMVYRARPRSDGQRFKSAAELGPPPKEFATQSNRMNPPGIPMFYGADNTKLAAAETRAERVSVGCFSFTRPVRILNLATLPPVPGFFSEVGRIDRLRLRFLHLFSSEIVQPVDRTDRINVDYVPTQVFTEYLRDYGFRGGSIDGVKYRSATDEKGNNFALFAAPEDVEGATIPSRFMPSEPWLKLEKVKHIG